MLSPEKAEELAVRQGGLMILYRATVALCPPQVPQDVKRVIVASGVLVAYKSKTYIATASHYLEDVPPNKMTVIFGSESSSKAESLDAARMMQSHLHPQTMDAVPVNPLDVKRSGRVEDVALLEINPNMVPKWCAPFKLESDYSSGKLTPKQRLLMLGYPSMAHTIRETGKTNPDSGVSELDWGRIPIERAAFVEELEHPERIMLQGSFDERGFFPELHFAVSYDPTSGLNQIAPEGLSGCGVWRDDLKTRDSGLFVPEPVLLGIEVAKIESRNCLKVTRTDSLIKLIERKA